MAVVDQTANNRSVLAWLLLCLGLCVWLSSCAPVATAQSDYPLNYPIVILRGKQGRFRHVDYQHRGGVRRLSQALGQSAPAAWPR